MLISDENTNHESFLILLATTNACGVLPQIPWQAVACPTFQKIIRKFNSGEWNALLHRFLTITKVQPSLLNLYSHALAVHPGGLFLYSSNRVLTVGPGAQQRTDRCEKSNWKRNWMQGKYWEFCSDNRWHNTGYVRQGQKTQLTSGM